MARMYGHADDDITRQLAFRSGWTEGVKDPLERKIIDLGDGRAVAEIVEAAL